MYQCSKWQSNLPPFGFCSLKGQFEVTESNFHISLKTSAHFFQSSPNAQALSSSSSSSSSSPSVTFPWTGPEQGLILGSYFYGYFITQLPGGRIAEVTSAKWTFGISVFLNCLGAVLSPVAAIYGGMMGKVLKISRTIEDLLCYIICSPFIRFCVDESDPRSGRWCHLSRHERPHVKVGAERGEKSRHINGLRRYSVFL